MFRVVAVSVALFLVGLAPALAPADMIDVTVAPALSALDSDEVNVLHGGTVAVSSLNVGPAADVVDNLAADNTQDAPFLFGLDDPDQRMSITGFNSGFHTVRMFGIPTGDFRFIQTITLASSMTATSSLNPADYETALGTFPLAGRTYLPYLQGVSADSRGYFEMTVSAPAGTRSLLVSCGDADGAGDRIYEVQAITTVPEPTATVLVMSGVFGLLAYAWRKRK